MSIDLEKYKNKVVVIFASCADLLHPGHFAALKQGKDAARALCKQGEEPYLIFLLQSDPTLDRPEKNKPIEALVEREARVDACAYVDERINYTTEATLRDTLHALAPIIRLRILGDEYKGKEFTGHELNVPVVWIDRSHGWSTSGLRQRIWRAEETVRQAKVEAARRADDQPRGLFRFLFPPNPGSARA